MSVHIDPPGYKRVTESGFKMCAWHQQHPGEQYAGCTCSGWQSSKLVPCDPSMDPGETFDEDHARAEIAACRREILRLRAQVEHYKAKHAEAARDRDRYAAQAAALRSRVHHSPAGGAW